MHKNRCIEKLTGWRDGLDRRSCLLIRMCKFYGVFNLLNKVIIGGVTACLLTLTAFLSAEIINANNNLDVYLGLSLTIMSLQVMLAVCNVFDSVLDPSQKSKTFSMCGKAYSELVREISVVIDDLKENDMDEEIQSYSEESDNEREKYSYLCLMYSTKEQLILNQQPVIYFARRENVCK